MKFRKQILTCLCALSLLILSVPALASCNNDSGDPSATGSSAAVTTEQAPVTTDGAGTTAPAGTQDTEPPADPDKDYSYSDGIPDDTANDKF